MLEAVQFAVPEALPLAPVALFRQLTFFKLILSDAVPPNDSEAELAVKLTDDVGDVILIVGET